MSGSKRNFWVELKRRSVYQVATVYVVSAWILIQVAVAIFPSLNIPEWVLSLLIKIVILGFPITLIFSWIFEVSTRGIEITQYDSDIDEDKDTRKVYVISMILFSFLVAFSLAFGYYAFFKSPSGPNQPSSRQVQAPVLKMEMLPNSLAVLPFHNNSKDKDESFSDGMMVEILHKLFAIDGIALKSRTSTLKYKGETQKSIREIANELGVAHVLEGSITTHPTQDKVRININLVEGQTEKIIWTYNDENELNDIFAVHSSVAQNVAENLKITLSQDLVKRLDQPSTTALEPWKLYMRAVWMADTRSNYEEAERLALEAVRLDPNFADAHAFLGYIWLAKGAWLGQAETKTVLEKAYPYLTKAKQLNPHYSMTHVYLALMHLWYEWDFEAAEKEWNEFYRLNPSNPYDPGYVDFLVASGRFDEALETSLNILNNDFGASGSWSTTGLSYYFSGLEKEALSHYEEALEKFPDVHSIIIDGARTFIYTGQYERAIDVLKFQEENLETAASRVLALLAIAYDKTGNTDMAGKLLSILQDRAVSGAVGGSPSFYSAMVLAQRNEIEKAFDFLQRAYDNREVEMFWLKVEPPFEPLREDLRWYGLLQKVGF